MPYRQYCINGRDITVMKGLIRTGKHKYVDGNIFLSMLVTDFLISHLKRKHR